MFGFVGEDVVEAVAVDGAHTGCRVGLRVVDRVYDGNRCGVEVFAVVDSLWGEVPIVQSVGVEVVLDAQHRAGVGVDGDSDTLIDVSVDGTIEAFAVAGWGCEHCLDVVEGETQIGGVLRGVGGPGEVHAAGVPCAVVDWLVGMALVCFWWLGAGCLF